jgi:hypothetical protein
MSCPEYLPSYQAYRVGAHRVEGSGNLCSLWSTAIQLRPHLVPPSSCFYKQDSPHVNLAYDIYQTGRGCSCVRANARYSPPHLDTLSELPPRTCAQSMRHLPLLDVQTCTSPIIQNACLSLYIRGKVLMLSTPCPATFHMWSIQSSYISVYISAHSLCATEN